MGLSAMMRAVSDCHLLVAGRSQISRWLVLLARPYPLVAIPPVVCAVHCCTYSTRQRENGSEIVHASKRRVRSVCVRATYNVHVYKLKCVNAHTQLL